MGCPSKFNWIQLNPPLFRKMEAFSSPWSTIKKPLVSIGLLRLSGTPKSENTKNISISMAKCGKLVFSDLFPKC